MKMKNQVLETFLNGSPFVVICTLYATFMYATVSRDEL